MSLGSLLAIEKKSVECLLITPTGVWYLLDQGATAEEEFP